MPFRTEVVIFKIKKCGVFPDLSVRNLPTTPRPMVDSDTKSFSSSKPFQDLLSYKNNKDRTVV